MGLLNLIALGLGLTFLTLIFIAILAFRRMRSRARGRTLLSNEVPWQPDFSKNHLAQLPPAMMGVTQGRNNSELEQGYVWAR
jgi:hypothetical protein